MLDFSEQLVTMTGFFSEHFGFTLPVSFSQYSTLIFAPIIGASKSQQLRVPENNIKNYLITKVFSGCHIRWEI
jgi:hypothetical protein